MDNLYCCTIQTYRHHAPCMYVIRLYSHSLSYSCELLGKDIVGLAMQPFCLVFVYGEGGWEGWEGWGRDKGSRRTGRCKDVGERVGVDKVPYFRARIWVTFNVNNLVFICICNEHLLCKYSLLTIYSSRIIQMTRVFLVEFLQYI